MAKKQRPKIVPPRGPATNIRPAGAHEDKRRKAVERVSEKEHEIDDLKALGAWAFEDEC